MTATARKKIIRGCKLFKNRLKAAAKFLFSGAVADDSTAYAYTKICFSNIGVASSGPSGPEPPPEILKKMSFFKAKN